MASSGMTAEQAAQVGPNMQLEEACQGVARDIQRHLATIIAIYAGAVKPSPVAAVRAQAHLEGAMTTLRSILQILQEEKK